MDVGKSCSGELQKTMCPQLNCNQVGSILKLSRTLVVRYLRMVATLKPSHLRLAMCYRLMPMPMR
jgi:hypothetical protein